MSCQQYINGWLFNACSKMDMQGTTQISQSAIQTVKDVLDHIHETLPATMLPEVPHNQHCFRYGFIIQEFRRCILNTQEILHLIFNYHTANGSEIPYGEDTLLSIVKLCLIYTKLADSVPDVAIVGILTGSHDNCVTLYRWIVLDSSLQFYTPGDTQDLNVLTFRQNVVSLLFDQRINVWLAQAVNAPEGTDLTLIPL